MVSWPSIELRPDLNANWPSLIMKFLDEDFATDVESPWAKLRDNWPVESRLRNDWVEEEAAAALATLLRGNTECQEVAIAEGAVELLLSQLLGGSDWTKAAVAEALTTLAADNKQNMKKLKEVRRAVG
jgi:hypothetical protein